MTAAWLLAVALLSGGCGGVQFGQDTDEAVERAALPDRPTEPPDQDDPEDLAETTPLVTVPLERPADDDGGDGGASPDERRKR